MQNHGLNLFFRQGVRAYELRMAFQFAFEGNEAVAGGGARSVRNSLTFSFGGLRRQRVHGIPFSGTCKQGLEALSANTYTSDDPRLTN